MAKFYQIDKEINGKKYVCQFNGIGAALKAVDNSYIDGTNNTSIEKLARYLFEHVVVNPRMSLEDFGAEKIGTEEVKTINGVEYKARFGGIATAVRAIDNSYIDGTTNISTEKLADYLFKNVIVSPKNLSVDDFESMDDFNEVITFAREVMQGGEIMDEFNEIIAFAREVMQGNFREAKNEKSAKKASEE